MDKTIGLTGNQFMKLLEKQDTRIYLLGDHTLKITGTPDLHLPSTAIKEEINKEAINKKEINIELEISNILRQIGIRTCCKGYLYIRSAILMVIEDFSLLRHFTKILYPKIAQEYETTAHGVERCIRASIEYSFNSGNLTKINQIFGSPLIELRKKPSNSELIALIADTFLLHYDL